MKPKFKVGQVVYCKVLCQWLRIESVYRGRTSTDGRIKQMYVIGWDYGKSSTAVETTLRSLTKRERGQP